MRFRRLGASGLQVSVVGLGCNNFGSRIDQDATAAWSTPPSRRHHPVRYRRHLRQRTERRVPRPRPEGTPRDVIIATKFAMPMGEGRTMKRRFAAVHHAGGRGVPATARDRLHRPLSGARPRPGNTDRGDAVALTDLVPGKVRYIGSSNFAGWQIADAEWIARTQRFERFISAQNSYSLINRDLEDEVIPASAAMASASSRTFRSRAACSPASIGAIRPRQRATKIREERAGPRPILHRREFRRC